MKLEDLDYTTFFAFTFPIWALMFIISAAAGHFSLLAFIWLIMSGLQLYLLNKKYKVVTIKDKHLSIRWG